MKRELLEADDTRLQGLQMGKKIKRYESHAKILDLHFSAEIDSTV